MTRFKICGLRDVDSALVSADAGAAFLGLNFVHGVRRRITLDQGRLIVSRVVNELGKDSPGLVGLFADQHIDEVNGIIDACELDYAQLCGSEKPDYWDQIRAKVIKQVKVKPLGSGQETVDAALAQIKGVVSCGNIPLLDTYKRGHLGGTGHAFDWDIAAHLSRDYDVVLAGGLTPDNVATAIRQVDPWMVDVSSGVETDGVKDHAKIRAFAEAVKSAE
ncbi:MAG: phosphoribosylanthranilate isomerase [Dehalococcoidia bacterium]|nr:phosphoribosylanthranilate isomerase [Dehalococcoidia bacterium]